MAVQNRKRKKYTLRQRGLIWYVYYWDSANNKTASKCLNTTDKSEANTKAEIHLQELHQTAITPRDKYSIPIKEMWVFTRIANTDTGRLCKYLKNTCPASTFHSYRHAFKMLCDTTAIEFMSDITHGVVKDFAYTIMGKMSLSTAKVKVAYIRGIVRKCENEGWIKKGGINFTTILDGMGEDVESAHEPFVTRQEAQEILKYAKKCNENLYLILALGFYAGMRKGESANLLVSEIDLDRNQININNHKEDTSKGVTYFRTKSGKNRSVPIKKELLPILKKSLPAVQGPYLIVSNQSRYPQFTLREWDYLKDYLKDKPYMSFFTCHTARHSFASWAAQSGISIYKIQKWLGHSTVEMTARKYAHLQINDDDIDRF